MGGGYKYFFYAGNIQTLQIKVRLIFECPKLALENILQNIRRLCEIIFTTNPFHCTWSTLSYALYEDIKFYDWIKIGNMSFASILL